VSSATARTATVDLESHAVVGQRPSVLYLVHRFPYPPDKGDRIRSFHVLKFLSQRASVHLACLADEPPEDASVAALRKLCTRLAVVRLSGAGRWARALGSMMRGGTVTEGAFCSPRLRDLLNSWTAQTQFDATLASSSSMVPYMRSLHLGDVPAVVDLVDVDSQKWFDYAATSNGLRGWLYRTEGQRLRRLEQGLAQWARAATLVSEAEVQVYRRFGSGECVHSVPNGVDLQYFQPSARFDGHGCVFVGALDYRPNVDGITWWCREIWPAIHDSHPQAKIALVGRRPAAAVRRLSQIPGVEVVGQVVDVRPYLDRAAVAIVPLRIARGIQNKVLEAMAMGKGVVVSPQALEGLPAQPGIDVLTASTPHEWVDSVSRLLVDLDLRQRLGASARRYVERHHHWERCLEPLSTLLGIEKSGSLPEPAGIPAQQEVGTR
jgi:polysaccharide biosynthesis protein PslH